jgi:hypothetical protein
MKNESLFNRKNRVAKKGEPMEVDVFIYDSLKNLVVRT